MISISSSKYKAVFCAWGLIFLFGGGANAAVLINEFVYDAAGADTGQEWVELYNAGGSTVSLEGWTLESDENQFPGTAKAKLCGSIGPFGYYLIKEAETTLSSSTLGDLISGTLALGNAASKADGIQLLDGDGNLMDRVVYGSTDSDKLCGGVCSRTPPAVNGMSVSRSTPGAAEFIAVSSMNVTPRSGGGRCSAAQCPEGSGVIRGMITEVAPAISNDDFIELFIEEPSDLCGLKIYESDALIKTFPSVSPPKNSYVLIHASRKGTDESSATGDLNANGILDLYSDESSPGLTSTANNNLTLKNSDGTLADFVSWSLVPEDTYSSPRQIQYELAVSSGRWAPACLGNVGCYVAGSVTWFNRSSESISRRVNSSGRPKFSTPSNLTDWQVGLQSPGKGYSHAFESEGKALEVFQSPFSPAGDGAFSEAIIVWRAPAQSLVTIRLYDLNGRFVRALVDQAVSRSDEAQTVSWGGKDADENPAAVGIYFVAMELKKLDGEMSKEIKTVVVGRRLR